MEEPVAEAASMEDGAGTQRRKHRKTKHHRLFHLHRAQKRFLARAGVFVLLLGVIIILWYWMALRG